MRKHATTYYFLFSLLAVLFWNCLLPGSVMAETKTIQETDTLEHNAMWKAQEIQLKNEDSVITIQGMMGTPSNYSLHAEDFYKIHTPVRGVLVADIEPGTISVEKSQNAVSAFVLNTAGDEVTQGGNYGKVSLICPAEENGVFYIKMKDSVHLYDYTITLTYHPFKNTHWTVPRNREEAVTCELGTWEQRFYTLLPDEINADNPNFEFPYHWYRIEIPKAGEYLLETTSLPSALFSFSSTALIYETEDYSTCGEVYDVDHQKVLVSTPQGGDYLYENTLSLFTGTRKEINDPGSRILSLPKAGTYYLRIPLTALYYLQEYRFRVTSLSTVETPEESSKTPESTKAPETSKTPESTKATESTQAPEPGQDAAQPEESSPSDGQIVLAKGKTFTAAGETYKVTKAKATVTYSKSKKNAKTVKVPDTVAYGGITYKVTAIAKDAFPKKTLKTLTIGKNVTAIPAKTFTDFQKLSKVIFAKGSSLKKIGADAFSFTAITSITIPEKVTSIGDHAFNMCNKLKKAVIGDKVTTIGAYAFESCGVLANVTIGLKVKTIGANCFAEDSKLKTITIRSTVLKKVGGEAFARIHKKAVVKVPNGKAAAYKKLLKKGSLPSSAKVN